MKILIVYGSLLGKTARIAKNVGTELMRAGHEVVVKDVRETVVYELTGYHMNILACSTWDEGMLQFDYREFNEKLQNHPMPGRLFAIIGLGSKHYVHYCQAATILEDTVEKIKGRIVANTLKLDIDHDEPENKMDKEVAVWVKDLISRLPK